MKRTVAILSLAMCAISLAAQDAAFSYFSYSGHDSRYDKEFDPATQFLNPILPGYYPDPSVTRKGDTFYLVNSSFGFFPGVPIFESKDLVNWEQIGHVLDRKSQLDLTGLGVSEGIFAPAISYNPHNDTFYMITTLVGRGGNFFVKTKDPRNGWSDPVWLPQIDGIDPSFLFDTDGKAYIVHNAPVFGEAAYDGQRAIRLFRFNVDEERIVGDPIEIVRGGTSVTERPIWIEGPHLYHIGDRYYLMCAEGGTAEDHSEVIFRAERPEGPWEEAPCNPILTQRDLDSSRADIITSTGHADIIQIPGSEEWWAVFLGCRPYDGNLYNTGRDTYLLPVSWEDGWPVILKPATPVPIAVTKPHLPSIAPTYGNFDYRDEFDADSLSMRWITLRNAPEGFFSLGDGRLTIHPAPATLSGREPISALFARQQHPDFTVETELDFSPASESRFAGLAMLQNENHHIVFGKTLVEGMPSVVVRRTDGEPETVAVRPVESDAPVKLRIEGRGGLCSFSIMQQGDTDWISVSEAVDATNLSTARAGGFIGTVIGPYATR